MDKNPRKTHEAIYAIFGIALIAWLLLAGRLPYGVTSPWKIGEYADDSKRPGSFVSSLVHSLKNTDPANTPKIVVSVGFVDLGAYDPVEYGFDWLLDEVPESLIEEDRDDT